MMRMMKGRDMNIHNASLVDLRKSKELESVTFFFRYTMSLYHLNWGLADSVGLLVRSDTF